MRGKAQNILGNIFTGDMCVGENTFRPANVRIVRQQRTMSALQRDAREACDATPCLSAGRSLLEKVASPLFRQSQRPRRISAGGAYFLMYFLYENAMAF